MRSRDIRHINEALIVLRHFINLSAKLLPFLNELKSKARPTLSDKVNQHKIIDVYRSYEFDTTTSRILLNSDILDLIKASFEQIVEGKTDENKGQPEKLSRFLEEFERLETTWQRIEAN